MSDSTTHMEIWSFDSNFTPVGIVEEYDSLLWTDRYDQYGDFEIYTKYTPQILTKLLPGYFLVNNLSEHVMMVEDITVEYDYEDGAHVKVVGRSLECILDWRIIWGNKDFEGKLTDWAASLVNDNFTDPDNEDRKISFIQYVSSDDSTLDEITIDKNVDAPSVYNAMVEPLQEKGVGFKMVWNQYPLDDGGMIYCYLYKGKDRSYDQTDNPIVTFSSEYDNLFSSNYACTTSSSKNVVLVGGAGDWPSKTTVAVGNATGFDRREMYIDGSGEGTETTNSDGNTTRKDPTTDQLKQYGRETRQKYAAKTVLDGEVDTEYRGEVDTEYRYVCGKDYTVGDIVNVEDDYGHSQISRITEIIFSQDDEGLKVYPSFGDVVGIRTISISASNIKNYFSVTAGSYSFVGDWSKWTTNNRGIADSAAVIKLVAKSEMTLSFDYTYSCEGTNDYLQIAVGSTTVESAASGSTTTKSWSGKIANGTEIVFQYIKNSSVDSYDDRCSFENVTCTIDNTEEDDE